MKSSPSSYFVVNWIKKYWFMLGLLAVCLATVADSTGVLAGAGRWIKNHNGPGFAVASIFMLSGFVLSPDQLKNGLMDVKGTLLALAVIFVVAPLTAAMFSFIPMGTGIVIGLFLVAVMPSTLSSGVVMTDAAGGSSAHALVTTIVANILSVFTIPYALSFLLTLKGLSASVSIDKGAIMLKIGLIVVLPLGVGMVLNHYLPSLYDRLGKKISLVNQFLILFIVWIAMSQTRSIMVSSGPKVGGIVALVFFFHGILLLVVWSLIRLSGRQKGDRESILFMGGQKTLPLSVILQMTLFPSYGIVLLVCVLHHIVHLIMDGYLVQRLKSDF